MNDLQYTLGLDAGGFAAAASRAVSMLGSMELAVQGIQRAADAMASAFNQAASMERTAVAIGTITKSAKVTAEVMRDLKELSADTPFEMSDLAPAARALLGAGTAAGNVASQLKMLGDIASAADTDIGGIVSVFNQVRGKGKLLTDDFIQLAERGVAGLREEIARFKGISIESVADSLSKGLVSAKDLEGVFARMTGTGGIAFQAMERQSQTFSGKLSTLSDAWASLQIAFAQPINDALKPVIDDMTSLTETLEPAFGIVGEQVAGLVAAAHAFVTEIDQGSGVVEALGSAFGDVFNTMGELAAIPLGAIMDGIPALVSAFMEGIGPLTEWMAVKFFTVAKDFEASMLTAVANVLKAIGNSSDKLQALVGAGFDVANIASQARVEARGGDAVLNSGVMQTGPALQAAEELLLQGVADMMDGAKSRLNDFLGDAPARMDAAAAPARVGYDGRYAGGETAASTMAGLSAAGIGETVAASILDRLSNAGAPAAAPAPGSELANQKLETINSTMREVVGELKRINTQ